MVNNFIHTRFIVTIGTECDVPGFGIFEAIQECKDKIKIKKIHCKLFPEISKYTPKFTGITICRKDIFVAGYSTIYKIDAQDLKITAEITSPYFNDIHELSNDTEYIYVANTGYSNIVRIPIQDLKENSSIPPLVCYGRDFPKYLIAKDTRNLMSNRIKDNNYMHLNSIELCKNLILINDLDNGMIFLRKNGNYFIKSQANPVSLRTHDIVITNTQIVSTSVEGKLIFRELNSNTCKEYLIPKSIILHEGWCRGLMIVQNNWFFVGFTRFRNQNAAQRMRTSKSHIKYFQLGQKPIKVYLEQYFKKTITSIYQIKKVETKIWGD